MTIRIDAQQLAALSEQLPTFKEMAANYQVVDEESYDGALTLIQVIIQRENKIVDYFKETKDSAFRTHRGICKMENDALQPYKDIEKQLSNKRVSFAQQKEQERREQQRIADEKLKAEREEQALKQAAELADIGEHEAASEVIDRSVREPAPAAYVPPAVPKSKGTSQRGKWEIEVTDEDSVQREYCSPDLGKIKKIVEALENKHPVKGIRATWVPSEGYSRKAAR